jgi:hypothetical protein
MTTIIRCKVFRPISKLSASDGLGSATTVQVLVTWRRRREWSWWQAADLLRPSLQTSGLSSLQVQAVVAVEAAAAVAAAATLAVVAATAAVQVLLLHAICSSLLRPSR